MPPRRRPAAGGAGQGPKPLHLLDLPDALLVNIMKLVYDEEDCFHYLLLVCKRLHDLCFAPELLQQLEVEASGARVLHKARSALALLTQHGAKVQKLQLSIEPTAAACLDERQELAALAVGCLTALGAAGGKVTWLNVGRHTPLASASWLPALTALTVLRLGGRAPLQLPEGLSRLQQLSEAVLEGCPLRLPAAGLPASLTSLDVTGVDDARSIEQMSQLTGLEALTLDQVTAAAASLGVLACLPRLQCLHIQHCTPLPPSLPQLTRLTAVALQRHTAAEAATVLAALHQLTQLKTVALLSDTFHALPPATTRLRSLQRLWWYSNAEEAEERLPPGPWLANLQWLGVAWLEAAQAAADGLLASARQLRYLSLLSKPCRTYDDGTPVPGWDAFWDWAATHEPLCCLGLDLPDDPEEEPVQLAVLHELFELKRYRPALQWRLTGRHRRVSSLTEFLYRTDVPHD